MTFPNVFNADPGTKLNFLSFDHTTGRLVIEGTATVSADGLTVTTDPDTGITHPGWHGVTPSGVRLDGGELLDALKNVGSKLSDAVKNALKEALLDAVAIAFKIKAQFPGRGTYASDHLDHFLHGDGSPRTYSDGSDPSEDVREHPSFQAQQQKIEQDLANRISDALATDPPRTSLANYSTKTDAMSFYPPGTFRPREPTRRGRWWRAACRCRSVEYPNQSRWKLLRRRQISSQ